MAIGDIVKRIGDDVASWWGDRLADFLAGVALKGASKVLDQIEDETRGEATSSLGKIRDIPNLPPEFHTFIGKAEEKHMPQAVVAIIPYLIGIMIGLAMGAARPIASWMSYPIEKLVHSFRLDPYSIVTAWRRDPAKYEKLFDDLKDQGWDEDRIEALKFYTLNYPSPSEAISMMAHEAFEEEMVEKYGLDSEFENLDFEYLAMLGIDKPTAKYHWRSHWEHASWMQVVEMLHRGLITEEGVWDWFRLVEIPPYWRDLLIKTAYTWPTRVDVRRWYDMRTIDEARLRELYSGMGYRDKNLDDYIRWTKVYTDFGMMMTRFRNGWITEADIREWLKGLEIPDERIEQFIQEKTKPEKAARTASERDLTATDIIMGVKKRTITWAEGIELLMDMGYDEEEADFKLAVRIETAAGSPANMGEYKRLTQLWRVSQALPTKMTPAEIKAAEKELAEKYPKKAALTPEELKLKVDTIRRKRRNRALTRDEEIAGLTSLGLKVEFATAYADNDDLRLHPEKEAK